MNHYEKLLRNGCFAEASSFSRLAAHIFENAIIADV